MRSTHPFEQEEVMAYLDGEIPTDRAAEIALHMQKCAECQTLAAAFRNLSREISAWEVEPAPTGLTEQMNAEIAAAQAQPKRATAPAETTPLERMTGFLNTLRARPWIWISAGAMATLALVLVGLPNMMRGRPEALSAARDRALTSRTMAGEGKGITGSAARLSPRTELQELQKRMAQDEMASSMENSPAGERYAVSIEPGNAAPAPPPSGATPASVAPMIARTASISVVVKEFAGVEAAVKSIVARHSGYIGELNTATPPDAAKTFSATLRVPSAQLEATLAELAQLGRVEQEMQGGEEVTKQYTDLVARLKNSRATEERLLDVLRHNTGKVKDVLEVENEISRVRGEIEEMEADQRTLQSRVDFGTVTLSVAEEYKASLHSAPFSTGARLHNAFVTGYHSVVENVIGLLAWLLESGPTLLLWAALLFFPVRWAWKRLRRAIRATPKPAAA